MSDAPQSHARHKPRKDGLAATTKKHAEKARAGDAKSGTHSKRSAGVARLGKSKRSAQRNADRGHRKEVVPLARSGAEILVLDARRAPFSSTRVERQPSALDARRATAALSNIRRPRATRAPRPWLL